MDSVVGRLSDWDAADAPLAPLSQIQVEALAELKLGLEARPFPSHIVQSQDRSPENALSESGRSEGQSSSWQRSESGLFPAFCKLEAGDIRIHTGQQFLQWIHQVESSLIEQESLPYRLYIEELERQKGVTLALQQQVSSCLGELSDLNNQYEAVSQKTTELHVACQHLLMEQTKLAETSFVLQEKLRVFQDYEKLQHKLGSPTLSVHSETFLPLLSKIDEAIALLLQHPHYKESSVYLLKYRAILTRALDMIRSFVKSCLDVATSAASSPATPALSAAPHTAFTLFYGKFRAAAPRMRHLIAETERRAGQGPEYEQLLADMESYYLSCREKLLGPSVRSAVSQLLGVHSRDHCGLVRAGCAFLLHVCEDETQLHAQMFSPSQEELDSRPALSEFLERLCLVLYDSLRPLIIQVSHLETLAELTAILRGEVLGQHCQAHPYLVAYRRVAAQMLQDVQERLVYRTSVYIRTDILGYSPSPGDLAYPEKLEMMENIADHLARQQQQASQSEREKSHSRQNSTSSIASATSIEVGNITSRSGGGSGGGMLGGGGGYSSNSPADLHGMWYPPVRRTLLTLSKLYRCLERPIFQGLSQEVLAACLESIQSAAQAIGTNSKKSRADGQLFEIKHLLILREQIVPFQVEFQVKETSLDFSKIKTAAVSLFNKRGDILSLSQNNALLEFLLEGTPGVQEHLRDSKKEVDRRLKFTCEQFIQESISKIVGEVAAFNGKVETFYKMRGDKSARLSSQPWAGENDLQQMVARAIRLLKAQVPVTQRKMQLYLANRETEFILFRPIRSGLLTTFLSLVSTLRTEYSIDQQTIVACPTQEQLASILTSVMLKPKQPNLSREVSLSPELNHSRENSIQKDALDEIPEDTAEVNGNQEAPDILDRANGGRQDDNEADVRNGGLLDPSCSATEE